LNHVLNGRRHSHSLIARIENIPAREEVSA
jgi:hypothetical protein